MPTLTETDIVHDSQHPWVMTEESEMPASRPDRCRCPKCQQGIDHVDGKYHRELRAFLATLSHEQRRLFAAVEANRLGHGGVGRVSEMTGLCKTTIARADASSRICSRAASQEGA